MPFFKGSQVSQSMPPHHQYGMERGDGLSASFSSAVDWAKAYWMYIVIAILALILLIWFLKSSSSRPQVATGTYY
jgi:predicted MFS family arabinose efflux permease